MNDDVAHALPGAVTRGEIAAWFQAQVDIDTGAVVGAESLCRWTHPDLGSVPPDTFITIAEDIGEIDPIGRYMVDQSMGAFSAWSHRPRAIDVAVNISPLQLADEIFCTWLADEIAGIQVAGFAVTLEITEGRPIGDLDIVSSRLAQLRGVGAGISIDDFGTGAATLDHLRQLHCTELKIDRTLVQDPSSNATLSIAGAVAFAHDNGARVVAEGVETPEQMARVQTLGCDRAQGYLIGHAVARPDFEELHLAA